MFPLWGTQLHALGKLWSLQIGLNQLGFHSKSYSRTTNMLSMCSFQLHVPMQIKGAYVAKITTVGFSWSFPIVKMFIFILKRFTPNANKIGLQTFPGKPNLPACFLILTKLYRPLLLRSASGASYPIALLMLCCFSSSQISLHSNISKNILWDCKNTGHVGKC